VDIYELWKAKREGRFTLKHWIWAWLISARLIAVPWVFLYTLFGALVAGVRDWGSAVGACVTVSLVLLASHFINNYRDVVRGVDRYVDDPREARKIISTLKPYTAAAWVVPLRITGIWFQKASAIVMLAASAIVYVLFVHSGPLTLGLYLLGVFMALTYTDFWKPMRLGEVAAFLGHGFATSAFGFLSQSGDVLAAMLVGVVPGFISALAYSVDQYADIKTDFVERVRSIAEAWFNSKLPLGLYIIAIVGFFYHLITVWVALGIYPRGVLLTYVLVPFFLITAARVEYDREKGIRDAALLAVILLPALMCLGAMVWP